MARPWLTTSDRPWNIEKVPSVTMIGGQAEADGEDAVDEAEHGAEADAGERRDPGIEPGDHQQRGDDGGEIEHPADRQVDLADGQQEHHAERQHAEEGGVAEDASGG